MLCFDLWIFTPYLYTSNTTGINHLKIMFSIVPSRWKQCISPTDIRRVLKQSFLFLYTTKLSSLMTHWSNIILELKIISQLLYCTARCCAEIHWHLICDELLWKTKQYRIFCITSLSMKNIFQPNNSIFLKWQH